MYTTDYKTVTVNGDISDDYATEINLSAQVRGGGEVYLTWSISGGGAPNGFQVMWALYANPTYPSPYEGVEWLSKEVSSYTVTGLDPGKTYHFRVGIYRIEGGGCVLYSNDVAVNVT